MLETPLYGRFLGENKYLIFAPAKEYIWLVGGCVFGGAAWSLWGVVQGSFYHTCVGVAVALAGAWAALSLQWISFNLRERVYTRRQGPGMFPTTTRGSLNDLEVIFLLTERRYGMNQVIYRLYLQWRGSKEPGMVLQQDYRTIPPGQPLNFAAGQMYHLGAKAAQVLGVPIVDNASVAAPCPVPM